MNECFNAITLALWVYVLIPFWLVTGFYWFKDKRAERKRLEELRAEEDAELARLKAELDVK